ncbi:MAG: hypothetical protein PHQ23_03245 [Candidatus Wallbacteria bacterium]|nr:hypothetical protein [Candidatus Wallbacteria bacterium]
MAEYNGKTIDPDFDGHNVPLHTLEFIDRLALLSEFTEWKRMLLKAREKQQQAPDHS